jgi:hypothetical protein
MRRGVDSADKSRVIIALPVLPERASGLYSGSPLPSSIIHQPSSYAQLLAMQWSPDGSIQGDFEGET